MDKVVDIAAVRRAKREAYASGISDVVRALATHLDGEQPDSAAVQLIRVLARYLIRAKVPVDAIIDDLNCLGAERFAGDPRVDDPPPLDPPPTGRVELLPRADGFLTLRLRSPVRHSSWVAANLSPEGAMQLAVALTELASSAPQ